VARVGLAYPTFGHPSSVARRLGLGTSQAAVVVRVGSYNELMSATGTLGKLLTALNRPSALFNSAQVKTPRPTFLDSDDGRFEGV
jgi:hypothetical protein